MARSKPFAARATDSFLPVTEDLERSSPASVRARLPALPGGLRTKLALAISALLVVVGVAAFLAIDRGTRSELEARIDTELEEQYAEFLQQTPERELGDPKRLEQAANAFLRSQRYHAQSRIFVIEVASGRHVTSHPDVIAEEVEHELEGDEGEEGEAGLLSAPEGLADVDTEETGDLRVLTQPIMAGEERVGTFRVADPLESVTTSQEELRNAFLIVGAIALGVGILGAVLLASRITAPLRRVADTAATVDAGDLTRPPRDRPRRRGRDARALTQWHARSARARLRARARVRLRRVA